jgi:hypothetical protein
VQRATTNLPDLRKLNYQTRSQKIGKTSLRVRWERGDMIETYMILTGKERVDKGSFFTMAENPHGLRGHSRKLNMIRSRLDIGKQAFSQRVVNGWNKPPQSLVDAKTVNSFKSTWDKNRQEMDAGSY